MTDEEKKANRQRLEAAKALIMLTRSNALEDRSDLTHADSPNEAYEPTVSFLPSIAGGRLAIAATGVRQKCAPNMSKSAAKRSGEGKHTVKKGKNVLASMRKRAPDVPALNPSAYSSQEEVSSLALYYDNRKPPRGRWSCELIRQDKSVVEPAVDFCNLPAFFAKHTVEGFSLDNICIYLFPKEGQLVVVGQPPRNNHFHPLLVSAKCRPTIFSKMTNVYVRGQCDFRNVTPAAFKELFSEVLTASVYRFDTLVRLHKELEPADLLLHPSLLASRRVDFSTCDYGPLTMKFRAADILAHLKGKSKGAQARGIVPTAEASDSLPQLLIHELYLADGEKCGGSRVCGVEAVVEAIKQDFKPTDAAPLAAEGERDKEIDPTKEQKEDDQRLYTFNLGIAYRNDKRFDIQKHGGVWHNSLGEKLSVHALGRNTPKLKFLPPGSYYIEVRRTSE